MVLQPLMKKVLEELDFVNWYKALSASHQPVQRFADYDADEAREMIAEFGYPGTTYIPAALFYIVVDADDEDLDAGLNLSLKDGQLEMVLNLAIGGKHRFSGSFSLVCEKLGHKEAIEKPAFANYKELYALLKIVFAKFEQIKERMMGLSSKNTTMLSFVKE
ncbi:hypothetical protein CCY01nite_32180 [Chitinophaga cymbidii]|uniref:Uncharacterized protein n=2 Tax=Chitinophaga cymbidii TaxID=1096750 RepID=A0A512RMP6_9BACT|nr:hypothetical protein CCY01nite_32180 [Chitinophaga cymbidii]